MREGVIAIADERLDQAQFRPASSVPVSVPASLHGCLEIGDVIVWPKSTDYVCGTAHL